MSFRWIMARPEDDDAISSLQEKLNVTSVIARLLALRGITTFDKAKTFFRPEQAQIHDPFLMQDMETAACRLAAAVRSHEKVLIYGDYDVDGTTSTAIMYLFLKQFGLDARYFIPHRFKDGYGISVEGIEKAIETGATLVLSVDCGITAVDEAAYAREKGLDLIICDHHNAGDVIPDAFAVLDPKRPGCGYPFDGLSGAGVAFKLIQATISKLGLPAEMADRYLDLVAISIASDIVPLVDENRILMHKGLKILNSSPRIGMRALAKLIKLELGSISTSQIVFSLGPRINAAGRMGDASIAVELMISDNEAEAEQRAHQLEQVNKKRRLTDADTMKHALLMMEQDGNLEEKSVVVLHDRDWHLGVIGIVASRLVDRFCRPTVMLSTVDGYVKGSARSIKGFNIYNALKQCEDLLLQFGGHEFAAGLTMTEDKLPEFKERLQSVASCDLCDESFEPELIVDAELDLSQIDLKFWKILNQFEPFGPQNLRPVFVSRGLKVTGNPTVVGNGHLKMRVSQNGSAPFDVIGFNMHQHLPLIRNSNGKGIDIAYVLEENFWNNKRSLQIRLKDVALPA
ncbi:MAG: single-stranded-DNA-specific exonuclease RecJ [Candidatus Cyclonatronum sp.]|uniref:single-stranded-DNA-specific exonuclease RecJ n=1 Tax=Cyclonatronum sp. TaxID=3024185 RepID=UPI0025C5E649|nr:single-stranded-DNA-specific exonuclease RecJ [Cyclonatronum sp.]MCH8485835.1 single-stranded-DNA-specific exonuclease RecJ [Cyclonatronum sp.]